MLNINWKFLRSEFGWILLWSYIILVAGSTTGLINFRLQVFSSMLLGVIIGGWIIKVVISKKQIQASGLDTAILLFLLAIILSTILSDDIRRSLVILFLFVTYIFIFYRVLEWLRGGGELDLILRTFSIVGGLVVGFALFDLLKGYLSWKKISSDLEFSPGFQYRLFSVFGDANLLAAFMNLFLMVLVGYLLFAKKGSQKIILAVLISGSLVVQYFASSRGGLVAMGAGLVVIPILWIELVSKEAKDKLLGFWRYLLSNKFLLIVLIISITALFMLGAYFAFKFEGNATHGPIVSARTTFWSAAITAFRSSPLVGVGLGIYPSYFIDQVSIPPDRPYLHAHSVIFNFLAETGLIGIAAIGYLLFVVIKLTYKNVSELNPDHIRPFIIAISVLTTILVHSLVDHFLYFYAVGIPLVTFLGILLFIIPEKKSRRPLSPYIFTIPLLVLVAYSGYHLNGLLNYQRAVDSFIEGDTLQSAEYFDAAVKLDPKVSLYWAERGYIYSILSAGSDPDLIDQAIKSYSKAIDLEPSSALNYANLGMLYEFHGERSQAIGMLEAAAAKSPENPIYTKYLDFLKGEDLTSIYSRSYSLSETYLTKIRSAIDKNEYQQASDLLIDLWKTDDQNTNLYLGLAELSIAKGEIEKAKKYLDASIWVQSQSNSQKVEPILLMAEIELVYGDETIAYELFETVYLSITDTTSYGWGAKGWNPYAWFVFQKRGLPLDLIPKLLSFNFPPEFASRLLPLIDLYQNNGESQKASELSVLLGEILEN